MKKYIHASNNLFDTKAIKDNVIKALEQFRNFMKTAPTTYSEDDDDEDFCDFAEFDIGHGLQIEMMAAREHYNLDQTDSDYRDTVVAWVCKNHESFVGTREIDLSDTQAIVDDILDCVENEIPAKYLN